jgi:hypothetical protein
VTPQGGKKFVSCFDCKQGTQCTKVSKENTTDILLKID